MSSKKDKVQRPEGAEDKPNEEKEPQETPAESVQTSPEVEELQARLAEAASIMEDLQNRLETAEAQSAEYKDGWQRALADFQNYKRRMDAESAETYQNALRSIIRRYLPVLDDLERALAHRPADLAWAEGIDLIQRKLQTILEAEGVKRMEVEGMPFDPNFHEAVAQEPAEGVESGTIIGVIQQGYMLGERVIRPAQVRVAQ